METGAKVFVPHEAHSWVRANVLNVSEDGSVEVQVQEVLDDEEDDGVAVQAEVRTFRPEELKKLGLDGLPLQNEMDVGGSGVEDMAKLNYLHEPAILYNLRHRHKRGLPYTFTGEIILAVNPYQWLRHLYTTEQQENYATAERFELPPHVYATSAAAFRGMVGTLNALGPRNQSILVSGESGAGKTETVKILMGHLATVASQTSGVGSPKGRTSVIRKIIESNPLLESFGNAKTVRNDNSSRFGKFTQLQFDVRKRSTEARLVGSCCDTYLLEKTRVVGQSEGERNYHIFYQVLNAPDEAKERFGLVGKDREDFHYFSVGSSDDSSIEGVSDADRFQKTADALSLIGVTPEDQQEIFQLLSAILHIGQLSFELHPSNDEASQVPESASAALEGAAALLDVDAEVGVLNYEPPPGDAGLKGLREALTSRIVTARGESYSVPLSTEQAFAGRDALAKDLYAKLFDEVVRRINDSTATSLKPSSRDLRRGTISLLDIFGFESFVVNRFEQLCINYANEKLQQKFTLDVFKTVQQEYEEEGIQWSFVDYKDNADTLQLIESRMGVLSVLNEECVRPRGNDEALVSKLASLHKDHPSFEKPAALRDTGFVIRHYAGAVAYTVAGFLDKNRDAVPDQLTALCRGSRLGLVSRLYLASAEEADDKKGRRGSSLMTNSVSSKFKTQLTALMEIISATEVQYVRCLKPNPEKLPLEMNHRSVVEQLRCAGVVEAIRISRSAYPNRMPHADVCKRFSLLFPAAASPTEKMKVRCERILSAALDSGEFTIGKTRAYFRLGILEKLEEKRIALLGERTIYLQRVVRGMLARRRYNRVRAAAILLQTTQRWHRARALYLQARASIIMVQCLQRARLAKQRLQVLRENYACTKVQSVFRRYMAQSAFLQQRVAIVKIQSALRGKSQRRRYQADLAQAKEDAKLENQLRRLQERLEEEQRRRQDMESKLQHQQQEEQRKQADMESRLKKQQEELREAEAEAERQRHSQESAPTVALPDADEDPEPHLAAESPPVANGDDVEQEPKQQLEQFRKQASLDRERDELYAESSQMLDMMRRELAKLRVENLDLKQQLEEIRFNARKAAFSGDSNAARAAATTHQLHDLRAANQRLADLAEERGHELNGMKKQLSSMRDQMLGATNMAEMAGEMHNENMRLAQLVSSQKEELHVKGTQYQDELFLRLHHEQTVAQMLKMLDKSIGDLHPDVIGDCYDIYEQAILGAAAERMSHGMEIPDNMMKPERKGSIAARFLGWATGHV